MLFVAKLQNYRRGEIKITQEYTKSISSNFYEAGDVILKLQQKGHSITGPLFEILGTRS